jgi:hypothetical protein
MCGWRKSTGMDPAEDSDNVENGPKKHTIRMDFRMWPLKRHRAILCVQAQLVLYREQQRRALTQHDYMDFLQRKKWKKYQQKTRGACVGNYLSIIDPTT